MNKQKPTIDDVAALAEVGRTTVSRVLNNGPNVRPEVRDRVSRAVEMLNYKVNVQARNLAGGASRQIALFHTSSLDTEPNSYYHSGLELGALRGCAELGFQLVTHNINPDRSGLVQRIISLVRESRYAGIILTPPISDNASLIKQLNALDCPVVCVSAGDDVRALASTVGIDEVSAGFEVARHLIELGHRHFGYVRGIEGHISAEGRFDGFIAALTEAGIDEGSVVAERGNFTFHSGIECAQRILERDNAPTALICANDDMAAGALLAAHKMSLRIPEDISITGFDDTPVSEIVWPPLTTIHQPIKQIGRRAVELAVAMANDANRETQLRHEVIDYHIVCRASSSQPRADRLLEAVPK